MRAPDGGYGSGRGERCAEAVGQGGQVTEPAGALGRGQGGESGQAERRADPIRRVDDAGGQARLLGRCAGHGRHHGRDVRQRHAQRGHQRGGQHVDDE